jgi:hypothetical protein
MYIRLHTPGALHESKVYPTRVGIRSGPALGVPHHQKNKKDSITLSAISIMMLGVLVLLGAKVRGLCCDIMLVRVFGLVLAGLFWDFCCGWVFAGFLLVSLPFLFLCLLYTSCMLKGAYAFYKISLFTIKKKKKGTAYPAMKIIFACKN